MNPSISLLPFESPTLRVTAPSAARFRFGASAGKLLAAVIAFFLFAISAHANVLHLASTYKAVGKNTDGSSYTGTVSVKIISDTTFSIVWKIGDSVIKGFGMRMNDSLSATYLLSGEPGLVMYKVESDGTLTGIWAIRGQDGTGSETLTPKD